MEERFHRKRQALLQISRLLCEFKDGADPVDVMRVVTETAVESLMVGRASVGTLHDTEPQLLVCRYYEESLLQLVAEINGSLVQSYKAISEMQDHIAALDVRLRELENDLGTETVEPIEMNRLDLEQMQVNKVITNNEPTVDPGDYSYADIEFVRNSIKNGKPDRMAVMQWIMHEREKNPDVSYAHLANVLNK